MEVNMNSYERINLRFYQNSKRINFSLSLVGSEGDKFINLIKRFLNYKKIKLNIKNKDIFLKVLSANLIQHSFFGNYHYSKTPMNPNDFIKIREDSFFNIGYSGWKTMILALEKSGLIIRKAGSYFDNVSYYTVIRFNDKLIDGAFKYKISVNNIRKFDNKCKIIYLGNSIQKDSISQRNYFIEKKLNSYNQLIKQNRICIDTYKLDISSRNINFGNITYTRNFPKNFNSDGRYYGPWWQSIKSDYRKLITINDNSTCELDYNGMHLHLLYSRLGANLNKVYPGEDPYKLEDYNRKFVKIAFSISLNINGYDNFNSTVASKISKKYPDLFIKSFDYLGMMKKFMEKHKSISSYLFKNIGPSVFGMESGISSYIINKLTKQNILTLNIHDSFIIEKKYRLKLLTLMNKAFKEYQYKSIPEVRDK